MIKTYVHIDDLHLPEAENKELREFQIAYLKALAAIPYDEDEIFTTETAKPVLYKEFCLYTTQGLLESELIQWVKEYYTDNGDEPVKIVKSVNLSDALFALIRMGSPVSPKAVEALLRRYVDTEYEKIHLKTVLETVTGAMRLKLSLNEIQDKYKFTDLQMKNLLKAESEGKHD